MHNIPLYGLILCGGQSARMGQDKSLLEYHGLPQREYLFALLQRFCARVYTSCRADQSVPAYLNPLPDALAIKGPMNGIVSAFRAHAHTAWLVIAVDMPFVNEVSISELLMQRAASAPATCFMNPENGLPEPLCTVWEASAYALLETFVSSGEISPRKFLADHRAHLVTPQDARVIINVNTPEDRARLSGQ